MFTAALAFLATPLGKRLLEVLAALALIAGVVGYIYHAGVKHEAPKVEKAQAAVKQIAGQLAASNASIASHAALSAKALASAEKVQAAVQPKAARITAKALVLSAHEVKGETALDRWEDADAAVRASLQP